jgi:hypothetical protein
MGTRKTNGSEPLMTCREGEPTSKPEWVKDSGMSLAGARLLARWCPACRWREPGLRLLCGTREGACSTLRPAGCERERAKRQKLRGTEYRCGRAGGPVRSSDEALVMGVERRDRLIWVCSFEQPGQPRLWEETSEQIKSGRRSFRLG